MSAASPRGLAPATLLLCDHGTRGAAAAADLAVAIALPGVTTVVHCLVVPDLWDGMQGDDWLNDATTRDAFGAYVEKMLAEEARAVSRAIEARCRERGVAYRAALRFGEPVAVALAVAAEVGADLCVVGPPRRKGEAGLRSRMRLERLTRGLPCPLLVANRRPC